MRVVLEKLALDNFQGIKHLKMEFNGVDATIYGDNATGKTTVFNAMCWLLFDKPSTSAVGYTPKTKAKDGDEHHLDHSVEAVLELGNGDSLTLKKIYKETYVKKRGSIKETFTGHSMDYYVQGVPVKEKEYIATITDYIGIAITIQLLMMPHYFAEGCDWKLRRGLLVEIAGDISDADIIAANKELANLPNILKSHSNDEYMKIAKSMMTEINRRLQEIPARIDEAKKGIPSDVDDINEDNLKEAIRQIDSEIKAKQEERRAAKDTAPADTRFVDAKTAYSNAKSEFNIEAKSKIIELNIKNAKMATAYRKILEQIGEKGDEVKRMTRRRGELLVEFKEVAASKWDDRISQCPTCGREWPEDKLFDLKEKFNLERSRKLELIQAEGAVVSEEKIRKLETEVSALKEEQAAIEADVKGIDVLIEEHTTASFDDTDEGKALLNAIIAIENAPIQDAKRDRDENLKRIDRAIVELESRLSELKEQKSKISTKKRQEKRIEALEAEEKALAAEYEGLEGNIYLCEQFIRVKMKMLTDLINSRFKTVSFRLFIQQVNGGLNEVCEVMIPDGNGRMIPYAFANNAARINASLEIIDVLAGHFNTYMPVFIDNAESVTHLQDSQSQIIRLVVSESDAVLRLERE